MPGAERHTKSVNQCLGPPSVQMSDLCRHSESYEHKDASRESYQISNCLPIVIYFEEIPKYLKCHAYQRKWYPIEKANIQIE